ncbi:MAG TPA: glycosyltransferase family 1 protein [Candidatus Saccharimonadales bacterium]|nr:glycosyltransferase family 1 protein [Candidatus Saccharimonadales bacterium]
MKIAIDARKITGTTGRYALELIKNLEQLDSVNEYKILVLKGEESYFTPENKNFQVVVADFPPYSFAEQLGFNNFLRRLRPDLVHFCMPQQPLLFTGPAITTVHDLNLLRITSNDDMGHLELRIKKAVFAGLLWVVARRAKHLLVPSHYTKDDLVKFSRVSPRRISVTHEGSFETLAKPQSMPSLKNKKFLLYVGRAEPYKNNRRLIEAHQQLLKTNPDLRLVIVGKKDILRHADMQWVKAKGYKNIDFIGFVSNEQLAWLYAQCQAYVAPSLMEGFGLPGLEAMAYGAPVVSSNTTAQPEVYGKAALYFDPRSSNEMAKAIERVLANTQLRGQLIKKGEVQNKKYSWLRMAEQTLQIYQQTLKTSETD